MDARMKPNGYILHSTDRHVVISTGHARPSKNAKTGAMIQIWILTRRQSPTRAVATGADAEICGDCVHRGDGKGRARSCYVNVSRAPLAVWKAYRRGAYPPLPFAQLGAAFVGRAVRFGAYGDPVLIPAPILKAIVAVASSWTGYTHQWRHPMLQGFRHFLMASVDSEAERDMAHAGGWRTFRVAPMAKTDRLEVECPAMTRGVECAKCGLCKGTGSKAKSVVIQVHGIGRKYFAA